MKKPFLKSLFIALFFSFTSQAFAQEVDHIRPDRMATIIAPESSVVPAGMPFKAHVYLILTSSQLKPSYTGEGVETDSTRDFATMTLMADETVIPEGQNSGTQNFTVNIGLKNKSGEVENYPIQSQFTVQKPAIFVMSAAAFPLYRSCGNTAFIDVPALGDHYNPRIEVSDGTIQQSKESRRKWLIMPEGQKCKVSISSMTNGRSIPIGEVSYRVSEPPKPTLMLLVDGLPYDGMASISDTSRIVVQVIPDEEFNLAMPSDSRYAIQSIDVMLPSGDGPPQLIHTVKGGRAESGIVIPIEDLNLASGTQIFFKINNIYRLNFRNQHKTDMRFTEMERTIGVRLR